MCGMMRGKGCAGCSGEGMQEECSVIGMLDGVWGRDAHREGCLRDQDAGGGFGVQASQREGCLGVGMLRASRHKMLEWDWNAWGVGCSESVAVGRDAGGMFRGKEYRRRVLGDQDAGLVYGGRGAQRGMLQGRDAGGILKSLDTGMMFRA